MPDKSIKTYVIFKISVLKTFQICPSVNPEELALYLPIRYNEPMDASSNSYLSRINSWCKRGKSFDLAVITHYLQNHTQNISAGYSGEAVRIFDNYSMHNFIEHGEPDNGSDLLAILLNEGVKVPFPSPKQPSFTFIDLFAGIGGFRLAMQELNGKCVFSSEWNTESQATYMVNFGEFPFGDITLQEVKDLIPYGFDLLCAGFPCQPFSKGGHRQGFDDTRGTLFFDICQIVMKHRPKFLLLENVANLAGHDGGNTYSVITRSLDELGYYFPRNPMILSPDKFGVPILRPRLYIPCVRKDLAAGKEDFIWNFEEEIWKHPSENQLTVNDIVDPNVDDCISPYEEKVLTAWDEFYRGIDQKVIGFPVWMDFFRFEGDLSQFPVWKATFIRKNIDLYRRNRSFIDKWLAKWDNLEWCSKTHRKFEWQAGDGYSSLFDCLIQFRPSGIRVKRPDKFSTLVAMNHRQIIGRFRRRISVEETKLLQSFPKEYNLIGPPATALRQLGNSVNVRVVKNIFGLVIKNF